MNRTEFVNEVFKTLEEKHIYLYHDISKEEFEKHKQEFLKNVEKLDETHFEAGMLRLFALFKDAHTAYCGADFKFVNAKVVPIEKDIYINDNGIYKKIEKVNGFDVNVVADKLKELIPYEAETWAYHIISSQYIVSPTALQMIDCGASDEEIVYTCEGNKIVTRKLWTEEEIKQKPPRLPLYESSKFINDEVLYIKYRRCRNMENYPFVAFMEDVKKEWPVLPRACLVDVRHNSGGSDSVMYPLVKWLRDNKIKTYALMDEGTFSSGTFALAYLKMLAQATLIGMEAGQPNRAYGNCQRHEVNGKEFISCGRYFELTSCHDENAPVKPYCQHHAFDYFGVIRPDIKVKIDIDALNQGRDNQLDESLKIIENDIKKGCEPGC